MLVYDEMVDTGIDWLGDIPKSWELSKISANYKRKKVRNVINEELLSVYRDYGVVIKSSRDDNHNVASQDLSKYQLVEPDDLVTNKMKTWQGSIAISKHRGIVSPAYFIMSPVGDRMVPQFTHYLLRSRIYISQYLRFSTGIRVGQWDLEYDKFKNFPLLMPTPAIQQKIADFLDTETAKIDNLIAKQERLLQLLEEKRRATITHAVTRGLDPNVELKETNIPWLGKVPAHWSVNPLFRYVKENRRSNKGMINETVLTLSYGNIKLKNLDNGGLMPESFETYQIVKPGDIVLRLTDLQNDHTSLRVGHSVYEGIITSAYVDISSSFYQSKYLYYLLHAYDLLKVFYNLGGGLRQGMKFSDLKRLPAFDLSEAEQKRIISYLDDYIHNTEELKKKIQTQITLLRERRTSLISHAVTGKIKV